jgi:hypothetical protein
LVLRDESASTSNGGELWLLRLLDEDSEIDREVSISIDTDARDVWCVGWVERAHLKIHYMDKTFSDSPVKGSTSLLEASILEFGADALDNFIH